MLIISDEPKIVHVRVSYKAYVAKFKKSENLNKFVLINIDGFWQSTEITEVFIDAYERFQDIESKGNMIDVANSRLNSQG